MAAGCPESARTVVRSAERAPRAHRPGLLDCPSACTPFVALVCTMDFEALELPILSGRGSKDGCVADWTPWWRVEKPRMGGVGARSGTRYAAACSPTAGPCLKAVPGARRQPSPGRLSVIGMACQNQQDLQSRRALEPVHPRRATTGSQPCSMLRNRRLHPCARAGPIASSPENAVVAVGIGIGGSMVVDARLFTAAVLELWNAVKCPLDVFDPVPASCDVSRTRSSPRRRAEDSTTVLVASAGLRASQ
jgi:hypothetical protein